MAYNPNAEEVIDYFKKQSIYININKVNDNKWEWIISFSKKSVYSGETANGNIGHNLSESRQFFNNEKDAYYDAVIELIVLI